MLHAKELKRADVARVLAWRGVEDEVGYGRAVQGRRRESNTCSSSSSLAMAAAVAVLALELASRARMIMGKVEGVERRVRRVRRPPWGVQGLRTRDTEGWQWWGPALCMVGTSRTRVALRDNLSNRWRVTVWPIWAISRPISTVGQK